MISFGGCWSSLKNEGEDFPCKGESIVRQLEQTQVVCASRRHLTLTGASIVTQVPYVDVCDDARLALVAKGLNAEAQAAGVAATISAGIWPGIDQLMAVEVKTTRP